MKQATILNSTHYCLDRGVHFTFPPRYPGRQFPNVVPYKQDLLRHTNFKMNKHHTKNELQELTSSITQWTTEVGKAFVRSLPTNFDAKVLGIVLASILCLYGYELFCFTLSIDEELYSFSPDTWRGWISQGRWGMALINAILPPISAIPFVSTLIFGCGLALSALNFATLLKLDCEKSVFFCLLFIAFPTWPHVAEFNTLSFGVGIGLVAMSMGMRLALEDSLLSFVLSILLLSFSMAVYQAFSIFIVIVFLFVSLLGYVADTISGSKWKFIRKSILIIVLATFTTMLVQGAVYAFFDIAANGYIGQFVRVQDYITAFRASLVIVIAKSVRLFIGKDQIYLGWGMLITSLPLFGVFIYLTKIFRVDLKNALSDLMLLVLILCAAVLPIFISVAAIPARGLIYIPFIAAAFGSIAVSTASSRMTQVLTRGWLFAAVLASIYISNQLFYWDYLARVQDQQTALSISQRLDNLRKNDGAIPFTVIGALQPQLPVKKIEVFGASFFEWDGGNINRINAYMKIIGIRNIAPVAIGSVSVEQLEKAEKMPIWPSTDSVGWVDNVVFVKLGQLNTQQKNIWCSAHNNQTTICLAP